MQTSCATSSAACSAPGNRANLAASASRVRSSRLGADSLDLGAGSTGGSGRAVTRISVTAPSAKLAFGVGPLGASFGVAPSFGLVDYTDMNGDGFPDIVTPNSVTYTTPRGGYLSQNKDPGNLAVTNQDLTFALNAGIEASSGEIVVNIVVPDHERVGAGDADRLLPARRPRLRDLVAASDVRFHDRGMPHVIEIVMLTIAALMLLLCKVQVSRVVEGSVLTYCCGMKILPLGM